ncbi:MAG: endonuclease [Planctomycetaceae bacterium]|nr:endonuclease [Planctomycetaceae bacterium]
MGDALPLGSVRLRIHRGHKVAFIKMTHLGPLRKRWKRLARVEAAKHFGPLPQGAIVTHKDGDPLNVAPDNLAVIPRIEPLKQTLAENPALEARRRVNQSRATRRLVKANNKLRARIDRSVSVRRGQFYAVCHAKRMVIFVPCRTKRQAERFGELEAYRHLVIEGVRGARLEDDCPDYRREIPDEGQAWKWGKRRAVAPDSLEIPQNQVSPVP